MSRSIRLHPKARADLQGIWRYTSEHWGAEQADSYNGEIEAALLKVAENPALGSPREHVRAGLRKVTVATHAIYYFHDSKIVRVSRILHGSMDADAAF